jgi:hypothetical protein
LCKQLLRNEYYYYAEMPDHAIKVDRRDIVPERVDPCYADWPEWPSPGANSEDSRFRAALRNVYEDLPVTRLIEDPDRSPISSPLICAFFDSVIGISKWPPTKRCPGSAGPPARADVHAVFVEPRPRPLKQLLRACARYGGFPEATAVFGSSNSRLSAVKHLVERAKWSCAFRNMFYEALDIALPNVSVAPLGLDEMFIASAGEEHVRRTILGATFAAKTQAVLVANGHFWDVPRARRYREDFTEFLRKACWLASLSLEPARYWEELARARFLIVPGGQGVQASKVVEALLVLTVPVTRREAAFDQLIELGFPLLVVERWDDITQELLASKYKEFYPRLQAFRKRLLATNWYRSLGLSRKGNTFPMPSGTDHHGAADVDGLLPEIDLDPQVDSDVLGVPARRPPDEAAPAVQQLDRPVAKTKLDALARLEQQGSRAVEAITQLHGQRELEAVSIVVPLALTWLLSRVFRRRCKSAKSGQ